jgi:hypothetical protein
MRIKLNNLTIGDLHIGEAKIRCYASDCIGILSGITQENHIHLIGDFSKDEVWKTLTEMIFSAGTMEVTIDHQDITINDKANEYNELYISSRKYTNENSIVLSYGRFDSFPYTRIEMRFDNNNNELNDYKIELTNRKFSISDNTSEMLSRVSDKNLYSLMSYAIEIIKKRFS